MNQEPKGQQFAAVITATATGFAVAWGSTGPEAGGGEDGYVDLWMRRFDAAGRPLDAERQVVGGETLDHRPQDIAALSDGSLVVISVSSFVRTDFDTVAHRFTAGGAAIGGARVLHRDADTGIGGSLFSTPGADRGPTIC